MSKFLVWPMLMKPSLIRANAWFQDILKDWIVDIQAFDLLEILGFCPQDGWLRQATVRTRLLKEDTGISQVTSKALGITQDVFFRRA